MLRRGGAGLALVLVDGIKLVVPASDGSDDFCRIRIHHPVGNATSCTSASRARWTHSTSRTLPTRHAAAWVAESRRQVGRRRLLKAALPHSAHYDSLQKLRRFGTGSATQILGQCEQARNRSPNYMADAATKRHGSRGLFGGSRRLKPAYAIPVLCGRVAVLRCWMLARKKPGCS